MVSGRRSVVGSSDRPGT